MTRRSRRYFFWKKINKMIIRELSKNIQIEIDKVIMEQLLDLANSNVGDLLNTQDPATDKKETDTKKEDINFMYKWIREKSGK